MVMILVGLVPSPRQNKKYRLLLANPQQNIDFGQKGSQTYINHGDKERRRLYLARHGKEDWSNLNPGSASRWILWGDHTDIMKNLQAFVKKYDLEVPKGVVIRV
jgi:hypothetical protein